MPKIPKKLSEGEETLDLHLRAEKIDYKREVCPLKSRKWRVDFYFPDVALVVEVEGGTWEIGRHQRPRGFEDDCKKYNALTLAGFAVLRYTTEMVTRGDAIRDILQVVGRE